MNFRVKIFFAVFLPALLPALFAGGLLSLASRATAQTNSFITDSITTQLHDGPSLGRDLWFTLCQNYDAGGQNGKVDVLYVTSQKATTVHIVISTSTSQAFPVNANQIITFKIPLAWEVNTSGVVENKAIRVSSEDADISAYMMSFNPYTSEGMYIIPSIGWGKQYTIAAYAGLFESTFDYASEYATISNQNNTQITNLPSTDIRYSQAPTSVQHAKLVPFGETLQRGQVVQYKSIQAKNCIDYDMTGTILTSNNPIGVVGASMCPNIPCDYPYCDFVCEMNQPQRMWSNEYLTIPYFGRKTTTNKGDTFLAIPSVNGQTIYVDDSAGTNRTFVTAIGQYQPYWFNQVAYPTKFHSDEPFELLQYENSSTYPDPNNSVGDAAMTTMPSIDQYSKKIVFQTPLVAGLPYTFLNFVNIIIPSGFDAVTRFDGKVLLKAPGSTKIAFTDSKWVGYILSNLNPGTHVITCDTLNGVQGVAGAYIYGYGSYDSYSWPAQLGATTFNSPDTVPPSTSISGSCYCTHVKIADNSNPNDSKISELTIDSISNMGVSLDPNYLAGTEMDSSYYDICVADSSKPAFSSLSAFDYAGNRTTVASSYIPRVAVLSSQLVLVGGTFGGDTTAHTLWLKNTGGAPFIFTSLKLKSGKLGFSITSPISDTIPAYDSERILVHFTPIVLERVQDTLVLTSSCVSEQALLIGDPIVPLIFASDVNFGSVGIGQSICDSVRIENVGASTLLLTKSFLLHNASEFSFPDSSRLPISLASTQSVMLRICYSPIDTGLDTTRIDWGTNLEAPFLHQRKDYSLLSGRGIPTMAVDESHIPDGPLTISPNPTKSDKIELEGAILATGATISLIDVLGREVRSFAWHEGRIATLNLEGVGSGTYSIRVTSRTGRVRSEKLTIVR